VSQRWFRGVCVMAKGKAAAKGGKSQSPKIARNHPRKRGHGRQYQTWMRT
jgi:hypothetical protein